jgi:tetratricopeptide (TPR) repeat protein
LSDLTNDLVHYVRDFPANPTTSDIVLPRLDVQAQLQQPTDFDLELTLTQLLAARDPHSTEALAVLRKLALTHPDSAAAQASLGLMEWDQQQVPAAREHLRRAIQAGSDNPDAYYVYARILNSEDTPPADILPVLERVVQLKPDFTEAWLNLGLTASSADECPQALTAFSHVDKVDPGRAFTFYTQQAYCYLQSEQTQPAGRLLEQARPYARTPDEQAQLAQMLGELNSSDQPQPATAPANSAAKPDPEKPWPELVRGPNGEVPRDVPTLHWEGDLQHIEGVAKSFDCRPKGSRLHIVVDAKELTLEIDDPRQVVVRNRPTNGLQLHCGAQKPFKVGVFYVRYGPPSSVAGAIRELVF